MILDNPGLRGSSQITSSLYAGLQFIMPGEVAPAPRHTQSALRFIIEGGGASTTVDGEKTLMLRQLRVRADHRVARRDRPQRRGQVEGLRTACEEAEHQPGVCGDQIARWSTRFVNASALSRRSL